MTLCAAAQAVADIIRTTLGPRSMLKMLLDPNGGAAGAALPQC
jgi:chaperonin GroEL (HSP60 family)